MKKTKEIENEKKNNKGITLIALSVIIIVLIILASIPIAALTGENGLIKQAIGGKDSKEISEEKEIMDVSIIQAIDKDVLGNLKKDLLQDSLNSNIGNGKTEVIDNLDKLVIKFTDKNRYYEIDFDGNVEGPKELINDKNAGDVTKGNSVDGSEEKPYEINCIEDLVRFSIMVNEGNTFEGKHVVLMRTLDFKSIFSYNDYTIKDFGDLNTNGTIEDIRTELTKTDEGCIGFTPIGNSDRDLSFQGTFDGQNNKICNLYVNSGDNNAGLFNKIYNATIINLGMKDVILKTNNSAGGLIGLQSNACVIKNCYIEGTSKFFNCKYAGGIIGKGDNQAEIIIENCYSIGNLNLHEVQRFGGILGDSESICSIKKCYNIMDITSTREEGSLLSGIVGSGWGIQIEECYHIGDITNPTNKGVSHGILGNGSCNVSDSIIKNCYSIGNMTGNIAGGMASGIGIDIFNCYSIVKITRTYEGGVINGMNYGGHIVHCFGRRGDFKTLPEGELSETQILSSLSEYNSFVDGVPSYGHKDKTVLGYKCNLLYEDDIKAQEFINELNILITAGSSGENEGVITEENQNVWKMDTNNINNGYPILQWQE